MKKYQVAGYFVDGYSEDKKDKKRKQEIIDFLGCEFIEIWE